MLDLWRVQKAVISSGFLIILCMLHFFIRTQKPTGLLDMRLAGNEDRIVMATEAPDYIQIYSPATMKTRMYPSDERMNDMKIDKAGERIFVANKEGWLNIFRPGKFGRSKIRRKLGDVLHGVALSGDEKYLAVGIGSSRDYFTGVVYVYRVAELEDRDLRSAVPFATIPSRGDVQSIHANPDPENNPNTDAYTNPYPNTNTHTNPDGYHGTAGMVVPD